MGDSQKEKWEAYCQQHLQEVTPLLLDEGFELASEQPHIQGERYILSGEKLVLYGAQTTTGKQVIIKITSNSTIAQELEKERAAHDMLRKIRFAYNTFYSPEEILFGKHGVYTFYITEFIPQEKTFLERSLEEQFFLALKALEAQEGSHATTYGHIKNIRKVFELYTSDRYLENAKSFVQETSGLLKEKTELTELLRRAQEALESGSEILDLYSNFLTHWDFVPHNIRVHEQDIYLLDHTAIRFGNKYEGWARLMNFMTLHNPSLERALHEYVANNRSKGELESLRLMRIYRLLELIWFYASKLEKTEGNLTTLTQERVQFWSRVLEAQLNNTTVDSNIVEGYKKTRDRLRDTEEVERQKNLH